MKKIIQERLMMEINDTKYNHLSGFSVSLGTSIGRVRSSNEDRVVFSKVKSSYSDESIFLLIVSDGMGGMKSGSLAAAMSVSSFLAKFHELYDVKAIEDRVKLSINFANSEVYNKLGGEGGATFSLLIYSDLSGCHYCNIGDSRIYQASKSNGLTQLTIDDDVKSLLKQEGLSVDETILNGNGITKFIGMDSELDVDVLGGKCSGTFIIASDGVYRIGQKLMAVLYNYSDNINVFVERVISMSNWMGGVDNASCIVVDFENMSQNIFESYGVDNSLVVWDPVGSYTYAYEYVSVFKDKVKPKKKKETNAADKELNEKIDRDNSVEDFSFNLISPNSEADNDN